MVAAAVIVGKSCCSCCSRSPFAFCTCDPFRMIPRFCRSPRWIDSSSDSGITVPVFLPAISEPLNESCVIEFPFAPLAL